MELVNNICFYISCSKNIEYFTFLVLESSVYLEGLEQQNQVNKVVEYFKPKLSKRMINHVLLSAIFLILTFPKANVLRYFQTNQTRLNNCTNFLIVIR